MSIQVWNAGPRPQKLVLPVKQHLVKPQCSSFLCVTLLGGYEGNESVSEARATVSFPDFKPAYTHHSASRRIVDRGLSQKIRCPNIDPEIVPRRALFIRRPTKGTPQPNVRLSPRFMVDPQVTNPRVSDAQASRSPPPPRRLHPLHHQGLSEGASAMFMS